MPALLYLLPLAVIFYRILEMPKSGAGGDVARGGRAGVVLHPAAGRIAHRIWRQSPCAVYAAVLGIGVLITAAGARRCWKTGLGTLTYLAVLSRRVRGTVTPPRIKLARSTMGQFEKIRCMGITFDDVLLVPARSSVVPAQVDLNSRFSRHITLNIPLVSAAMDTVSEAALCIALARAGRHRRHS